MNLSAICRTAGFLVVASCLGSCASKYPSRMPDSDPTLDISGLSVTLELEPGHLAPGGHLLVHLSFHNSHDSDLRVRFPRERQIALTLFDSQGDRFHVDQRTVQLPRFLDLATFQTWKFTTEWDGFLETDAGRVLLEAGQYEMQAAIRRESNVLINASKRVPLEMYPGIIPLELK